MSCYKNRKTNCNGPDCEWIVGKGCRQTGLKQNTKKSIEVTKTKSIKDNNLVTKEIFINLCKKYKISNYDDNVFDKLNELLNHLCKNIFKSKGLYDINTIDNNYTLPKSNTYYTALFTFNGEKFIIKMLREIKISNSLYDTNFKSKIESLFDIKLKDEFVAQYIVGGLDKLLDELFSYAINTTRLKNRKTENHLSIQTLKLEMDFNYTTKELYTNFKW
jgi:hypothetical protein